MGLLDKLTERLSSSISKLEAAAGKTAGKVATAEAAAGAQSGGGGGSRIPAEFFTNDQRALNASIRANAKALMANAKAVDANTAEQKAMLPQIKSEAKLAALRNRTEEQQLRAQQQAKFDIPKKEEARLKERFQNEMKKVDARIVAEDRQKSEFEKKLAGLDSKYASQSESARKYQRKGADEDIERQIDAKMRAKERAAGLFAGAVKPTVTGSGAWEALMGEKYTGLGAKIDPKILMEGFMGSATKRVEASIGERFKSLMGTKLELPGKDGKGFFGGASALLMPAAIGGAVASIVSGIAQARNVGQLAHLTQAQQQAGAFEALPGVGHVANWATQVSRNYHGTNAALINNENRMMEDAARIPAEGSSERRIFELQTRGAGANLGAAAVRNNPLTPLQTFDRMTGQGAFEYQQYQRRRPLLDALTMAQREQERTRGVAGLHEARAVSSRADFERAQQRHRLAVTSEELARIQHGNNPLILQTAARRTRDTGLVMEQSRTNLQEADTRARNESRTAIEAEANTRRGMVSLLEDDLARLKERAQLTRTAAGRFGSMGPAERQQYEAAARIIHSTPLAQVPVEIQQMFGRGSPEELQRRQQEAGIGMGEFQRARARGDLPNVEGDFQGNLGQQARIEANIRTVVQLNAEQISTLIAASLNRDIAPLIESIRAEGQAASQRIRTQLNLQNVGQ